MKKKKKLVRLVLFALFSALVVIMTFTPNFGYITIGNTISITTIHIVVILGSAMLGPAYGAGLGGVWGMLCLIKAFMEPILVNIPFQNPIISVLPRVIVGLVVGLIVYGLSKTKIPKPIYVGLGAIVGTLTNTALVITALNVFNGFETITAGVTQTLETIITILISVNGIIELVAAVILVPSIYMATHKIIKDKI